MCRLRATQEAEQRESTKCADGQVRVGNAAFSTRILGMCWAETVLCFIPNPPPTGSWANGLIDGQVRAVNASGHPMSMAQLAQKDARPWARESWRGREKNMTISTWCEDCLLLTWAVLSFV